MVIAQMWVNSTIQYRFVARFVYFIMPKLVLYILKTTSLIVDAQTAGGGALKSDFSTERRVSSTSYKQCRMVYVGHMSHTVGTCIYLRVL